MLKTDNTQTAAVMHPSIIPTSPQQSSIVLFYKYFLPSAFPLLHKHRDFYEEKLVKFQNDLCRRLSLKGRILLASEGINGTLSASDPENLKAFIETMEDFELIHACSLPEGEVFSGIDDYHIFRDIDWKKSTGEGVTEPFPDLKVALVKEIISTGSSVSVEEISSDGGQHLSPVEFHKTISENPDVVLIDVRNTFEYDIGHFVNPNTQQPASNPETQTFPLFDSNFCAHQAEKLADKKVLMYCTGGIRCEKASVMLKRRGVKDISQLSGGIHRYLEEYGDQGYFKGLNFVFDQRVAMKPSECCRTAGGDEIKRDVVGKCIECTSPFDEISGSRLCTVCRDLVLVCETCQNTLREYHCRRHSGWKNIYFTFLEVFSRDELECQRNALLSLRNTCVPVKEHKNVRKTLSRQIAKVTTRINALENGDAKVEQDAPRRCRTCMAPSTVCDGKCWGFWKTQSD